MVGLRVYQVVGCRLVTTVLVETCSDRAFRRPAGPPFRRGDLAAEGKGVPPRLVKEPLLDEVSGVEIAPSIIGDEANDERCEPLPRALPTRWELIGSRNP